MPLLINQPPSLFSLCKKTIEDDLFFISSNFLENKITHREYFWQIKWTTTQLTRTPPLLQDEISRLCLMAANRLSTNQESSKMSTANQTVIEQLVRTVTFLKIKKLNFSEWSKPVQSYLYKFLQRMSSLEQLNFDFNGESTCLQPIDFTFLPNLTHFTYLKTCADSDFIMSLCLNCRLLEYVTLRVSTEVISKTGPTLSVCWKHMRSVNLHFFSDGSMDDIVKVFLNSHSDACISVINDNVYLHSFLRKLEKMVVPFRTFNLQKLLGIGVSEKLTLIPKFFPNLCELELEADIEDFIELSDLSCLESLKNLKVFKLQLYMFEEEDLAQFFTIVRCSVLTSLNFEFSDDTELKINISDFLNMGSRCSNLEQLKLVNCSFLKDANILHTETVKPFSKLKNFEFESSSVTCIELILRYALNIESLCLKIADGLTDEFVIRIFTSNPLKNLRELDFSPGNSVSIRMLKDIIINCKQISFLGNFIPVENAPIDDEFDKFKQLLIQHNVNVDFK